MIGAGTMEDLRYDSGIWVFIDLGFAQKKASCGLLEGEGKPEEFAFNEVGRKLSELATGTGNDGLTLNLVIEAPLSVAFTRDGNPTGRKFEKRQSETRYWYVGLGCSVLVAATYIMRQLVEAKPRKEIRLFEGFASFKPKGQRSSHMGDVCRLRQVVREYPDCKTGVIIAPDDLRSLADDRIESAFAVANMSLGVPPVVVINAYDSPHVHDFTGGVEDASV